MHLSNLSSPARAAAATTLAAALLLPTTVAGASSHQRAQSILPPGNSQTYTVDGVAAASASGEPDDTGPWIDDQREMYWDYEMKDATFIESAQACGGATDLGPGDRVAGVEPVRDGVDVCWSEYGVPAVFGETIEDVWWGHGWAAAKLRLFILEGAIRTGAGTLAELAGEGSLPQDIERRTTRYSPEEYTAMVNAMSPEAQTAIDEYVEGVNAYIDFVNSPDGAAFLPAEYAALSTQPTHITREGVAALGVEMTRFVASEGRTEIITAEVLKQLEGSYGQELGRRIFRDLYWQEDTRAATTILAEEGVFPRTDATEAQRLDAFEAMADFAASISLDDLRELREGPGIAPWVQLESPTLDSGNGDGTGDEPFIINPLAAPATPGGDVTAATTGRVRPADVAEDVRAMLAAFTNAQEGASWMVMMDPSRTADGSTLLMSEPQLDYDGGNFLMEVQLTGPGINARGSTVAGLPIVGIGYTPDVAWALTTGNSKTIDTFVEQTRPDSNDDGAPEYFHDGVWKDMDCRTESVPYRQGSPVPTPGLPALTEDVQICRTVHGPVVANTEDWSRAITWQWHMAGRELDTIEGVLDWQHARSLDDIAASIPKLTWNENIGAVDSQGNIGFWHPGIHLERTITSDPRLPIPGTGEHDLGDPLPQSALPHLVNPERGWIVNWNNKPAHGWLDGGGIGTTSYPAGVDQRVATLADLVASRDDWTFDELIDLDEEVSQRDFRARTLLPLLLETLGDATLDDVEQAALALLEGWDRNPLTDLEWPGFADTNGDTPVTVGAAPTLFDEVVEQLDRALFTEVTLAAPLLVSQQYMGRHIVDTDTHLHLALRVLDADASSLTPNADYTQGRSSAEILLEAFGAAVAQLRGVQGDDTTAWRSVYFDDGRGERGGKDGEVCTASGAVGPCGRHWYIERGAWVHHVGFAAADPVVDPTPDTEVDDDLAATGGGSALLALALLAVAVTLGRRRSAVGTAAPRR